MLPGLSSRQGERPTDDPADILYQLQWFFSTCAYLKSHLRGYRPSDS
jgi:hypothetical protein